MTFPRLHLVFLVLFVAFIALPGFSQATMAPEAPKQTSSHSDQEIPVTLKPWQDWATWNEPHRDCPTPYTTPDTHWCFWPSLLKLDIDAKGGRFEQKVTVFAKTWIPLPGGADHWPMGVNINSLPVPVVEHLGQPSIELEAGTHLIRGTFSWQQVPRNLPLPKTVGLLDLTLDGQTVPSPSWEANGNLWLKRGLSTGVADKNFIEVKVNALLEDGIPLLLQTEVELIVAGKSREELLGSVLPAGWKLSAVQSPLPVMVDEDGQLRAQVRAGRWTVSLQAFRLDDPKSFSYEGQAAVRDELVAFRAKPDFRMVDIEGSLSVDISQIPFPKAWSRLPVYRWDTSTPFRITERMRGMGQQKPAGLSISRTWWLDGNGKALTFRDQISGSRQEIWRLDVAPGLDLGSVRSNNLGQLITRNPENGAAGVEIRTRNLNLEATGRMERGSQLSATGWRSDADALNVTLNLPPGWRLFALFGADWVRGDWLTAWTLLDLFLLLIFSLAVFRLYGFGAAVLAFFAFGISHHEPGAPCYLWLVLLLPLALLRVVHEGWGQRLLVIWKWITVAALIFFLIPFVAAQVQQTLYPQLEVVRGNAMPFLSAGLAQPTSVSMPMEAVADEAAAPAPRGSAEKSRTLGLLSAQTKPSRNSANTSNLLYDDKARIQTGPGIPDWHWRTVSFGWNGPVQATQTIRPFLISLTMERLISILRVVLLLALLAALLRRRSPIRFGTATPAAALLALAFFLTPTAQAQFPDQSLLNTLRERLLEPSDAYPTAADISQASLSLQGRRLVIVAEVHSAIRGAVPLPARLSDWSPLTVSVNGQAEVALRREDGSLWVVLPAGVHTIRMEGLLADVSEWEWTFQLKPRRVEVQAPGWTVSGLRPNGIPENQLVFVRQEKDVSASTSYDRQNVEALIVVDRHLELGLVWQVNTTVSRLSSKGKSVSLRIPLLPGENVLNSKIAIREGKVDAQLGAQQDSFSWKSEMPYAPQISLKSQATDSWVERWHLVASPVWNVALSGLPPIFEPGQAELIPVWHPWPGESVTLDISRPEAISGATVTVNSGTHAMTLGQRQRVSQLDLVLRCSLGEDFLITLPEHAEVTTLTLNQKPLPVRKDGQKLIIPLRPGEQSISVGWTTSLPLGWHSKTDAVSLPVESANIQTTISIPDNRWVLGTHGPLRGPAVRFWTILLCSLIAAWALSRIPSSPLRPLEWILLALGLTQVPLPAALVVVAWLFFLVLRGRDAVGALPPLRYNLVQIVLIGLTAAALGVFVSVVGAGLLGNPEMFIRGNESSRTLLRWYQPRGGNLLPEPGCFTVSIWWFRLLMLAWALWLAVSLLRWLRWGWEQFSKGGCFHRKSGAISPPPIPK